MYNEFPKHNYIIVEIKIEKNSGRETVKGYGDISSNKTELYIKAKELNSDYLEFNNSKHTRYTKRWHVIDLGGR